MTHAVIEPTTFRLLGYCLNQQYPHVPPRSALLTEHYSGDNIKKIDVDEACGTHGGEVRCVQGFGKGPEGRMLQGTPRRKWQDNIKKYS
jgi:hypothetical protein